MTTEFKRIDNLYEDAHAYSYPGRYWVIMRKGGHSPLCEVPAHWTKEDMNILLQIVRQEHHQGRVEGGQQRARVIKETIAQLLDIEEWKEEEKK